jgi:hypothetical protein
VGGGPGVVASWMGEAGGAEGGSGGEWKGGNGEGGEGERRASVCIVFEKDRMSIFSGFWGELREEEEGGLREEEGGRGEEEKERTEVGLVELMNGMLYCFARSCIIGSFVNVIPTGRRLSL